MPIIDIFRSALLNKIKEYQDTSSNVSEMRKDDIIKLKELISTINHLVRLHRKIEGYLKKMKGGAFSFIPLFDFSKLKKLLKSVLEQEEFSKENLQEEYDREHKTREALIGKDSTKKALVEKIEILNQELNEMMKQATLAIELYKETDKQCQKRTQQTQKLIKQNKLLEQSNEKLRAELTDLKDKFKAWCNQDTVRKRLHELETKTLRQDTAIAELVDVNAKLKEKNAVYKENYDSLYKNHQNTIEECKNYKAEIDRLKKLLYAQKTNSQETVPPNAKANFPSM